MKKEKKYLLNQVLIIVVIISMALVISWRKPFAAVMANKVLRFHVIANSDSKEDQEIKYQVRDAVGGYMQVLLKEVNSKKESQEVIMAHREEIKKVAEAVLQKNNVAQEVSVGLEHCQFPEKTYGAICMPAGEYDALRIVLGKGEGHNWWCVMYPNMCFANGVYYQDEHNNEEKLYQVLTIKEYKELIQSNGKVYRFAFLGQKD